MTPFEIGILLHYYCRCDDCEAFNDNVPIWSDTRDSFIADQLIEIVPPTEVREAVYRITDRGNAYVAGLMRVPLPEQQWIIPAPSAARPKEPNHEPK